MPGPLLAVDAPSLLYRGDYRRSRSLLDEAIANLEAANDTAMIWSARYHQASVAFGLGNLEEAEAILKSVIEEHGAPTPRVIGWAIHLRGLVAHALGNTSTAFSYLQESLRRFWESKAPSGYGESLAGIAVVLASAGDATAARFWGAADRLNEDRGESFHQPELGVYESAMKRLASLVGVDVFEAERAIGQGWSTEDAIQAALVLPPPSLSRTGPAVNKRTALPAGLSAREAEVLRLVMEGLTNDRIADSLFLSPRTVHAHLTSVYRKLGVTNRAEAVRVAVERGFS